MTKKHKIKIALYEDEWETIIKALHLLTMFSLNRAPLKDYENPFAIMDYIVDKVK